VVKRAEPSRESRRRRGSDPQTRTVSLWPDIAVSGLVQTLGAATDGSPQLAHRHHDPKPYPLAGSVAFGTPRIGEQSGG
jgi:hypothetical protein